MPFLDAKALEADPDGMAFLRSVIRPNFELEEAASPAVARPEARLPAEDEVPRRPAAPEPVIAAPAA